MSEANAGKEAYRETGILTKSPDIQPVELIAPGGLFDEDTLSALSSQLSALSSQLSALSSQLSALSTASHGLSEGKGGNKAVWQFSLFRETQITGALCRAREDDADIAGVNAGMTGN